MIDDDRNRDDDEYIDDADEENDDDESVSRYGDRRPSVNPFRPSSPGSSGSAGSPGSYGSSSRPPAGGSSSTGRDTSGLPGSRPGGYQSRFGGGSSGAGSSRPTSNPASSSGSRPGSSGSSRPAFYGGVIGARSDDDPGDEPEEEKREERRSFGSSGSSAFGGSNPASSSPRPSSSGGSSAFGSSSPASSSSRPSSSPFRSGSSGGDRSEERRDVRSSSGPPASSASSAPRQQSTGGGFRSRFGGGGEKKPAAPKSSSGGSGNPLSKGLGGLRSKLPGSSGKSSTVSNRPPPSRSSSGGPLGSVTKGLGGLRSRLPGGKKDNASSASASSASRTGSSPASSFGSSRPGSGSFGSSSASASSGSRLGNRSTGTAPAVRSTAASAASGGLLSKLPFVGKKEAKPRPATTREKIERASKAPRIDERGLSLDNKLDILGVGLLLGSLALFFSSMSATKGQLTEVINANLSLLFGLGAIAVPVVMFAAGMWLIVRHFGDEAPVIDPVRLGGIVLIYVGSLLLFQFLESFNPAYAGINLRNPDELRLQLELSSTLGHGGGMLGSAIYYWLVTNWTEAGMTVFMIGMYIIGFMLLLRISAAELAIFFISIWRSFADSQRRRAETREARTRLRAAELAAAAGSRVSISSPAAAELPGAGAPALAAGSAESAEEPRPIPITMGGRTVTAFFDGSKEPVGAEADLNPAAAQNNRPSIAARVFSAVPLLGRGSEQTASAAAPASAQKSSGLLGGLRNRRATGQADSAQTTAAPAAATASAAAAATGTPPVPAPASVTQPPARPASPVQQPLPVASAQTATSDSTASAQPQTASESEPARLGDLLKPAPRPSPFTRPGMTSASSSPFGSRPTAPASQPAFGAQDVEDDEDDEDDEEIGRIVPGRPGSTSPARPASGNLWSRPNTRPAETAPPQNLSLEERRERLNAIRGGQTAHPSTAPAQPDRPAQPQQPAASVAPAAAQERPAAQRSPVIFRDSSGDQNGSSGGDPAMQRTPQQTPSPAFARPAGPPAAPPPARKRRDWKLPELRALLSTGSETDFDREVLLRQARTIEETLQSFGAPGRVVEVNTGPVITQFGVEPDYLVSRSGKKSRVKVGAIAQLDKDLQLALGAKSIRIEAPVPGKGYVGIEVPNEEASIVSLRDVMESDQFKRISGKSPLAIGLGQSVDGTPVSADLGVMPHLLIAGTTGSGKSVLVNSIICCLLTNNPPDRVKFVMVDPKRVELTGYNGIPHLVAPVVVDLERTVGVLKWVTREMDERYKQFSNAGARNIEDFNKHVPSDREPMPYIVVIIDELADLMMMAPDETERVITRIAALARATGIHLVIATQRPSVDVVTGLIKANFPARVAFAVAGGVDSRVILDQPGAERLLGRGDMLYLSGSSPAPLRLQGVWVSEQEITNITRYWKRQNAEQPEPHIIKSLAVDDSLAEEAREVQPVTSNRFAQQAFWDSGDDDEDGIELHDRVKDERDELYDQAVEMVRRLNKASVSLLQRRLRIGYTRAARLIDMMEAEGIVGPAQEGSKPREVMPPQA